MQKYLKERKGRFRHKMLVLQKKKQKCRMLKIYKEDMILNLKWKTQYLYALFATDIFK